MAYIPQQSDLNLLRRSARTVYSKIELLNRDFKVTGRLEGELISDDYSYDADSDIRRSCRLTLVVKDSSFLIGNDRKVWIDKYLRVYTGLYSQNREETVWYPVGVYILNTAGYSYNETTRTLSLDCEDRMAELTGGRNGKISGFSLSIDAGAFIEDAMRHTVTQLGGVSQCRISGITETVPYDLEFGAGSNVYDVVAELRDLYPGYETFFDSEFFIFQPYPTCASDPVVLDAETISPLVLSEGISVSFSEIRNVSEVWGMCYETDNYTDNVTLAGAQYSADYGGAVAGLSAGYTLGFKAGADNPEGALFKADATGAYPIVGEGNIPIAAGKIKAEKSYVLKYMTSGSESYYYFCGQYQICAVSKLVSKEPTSQEKAAQLLNEPTDNVSWVVNADSPFCCDLEGVGEIREVYSGGEFDNIYSDELAGQRAKYETWKSTDLKDSITLEMIDVPWLDVNQKIEYRSGLTGETQVYIVKQKRGTTTGGVMTLTCVKFQPLYSWTD